MKTIKESVDLVIAGGGTAGHVAALQAARLGIKTSVIRAGKANMFLSKIFRETLAGITGATIELYNTDGSIGAAKGAGVGNQYYNSFNDAFSTLKKIETIQPDHKKIEQFNQAYVKWNQFLLI